MTNRARHDLWPSVSELSDSEQDTVPPPQYSLMEQGDSTIASGPSACAGAQAPHLEGPSA